MGSRGGAGGSGGNTGADAGFFVSEQAKKDKKQAQINEKDDTQAKADLFRNTGAINIKNLASKVPSPALAIASGPLQAGSRITRDFFTDKVLGSKNYSGTTKADFQKKTLTEQNRIYDSYMEGRQSGQTDAYGNPINNRDDRGPSAKSVEQPKVAAQMNNEAPAGTTTGPTDVEVGQTYAEATMDRKKRGRKSTVLTSVTGDTSKPTLAKKVLLGG
tara:strand:+ start:1080 stop:1727 length:648 start_codon:yes stop_codon:yes gene_type:complete